jgi:1-acyl-sn-glycerol-3-phosphate acyltransferase
LTGLAEDGAAPTLAPAAILYGPRKAAREDRFDAGWYGDMTFVPHLWSLMKRGGAKCHILWGEAVDPRAGDRKALAATTEQRVRALLDAGVAGRAGESNIARKD